MTEEISNNKTVDKSLGKEINLILQLFKTEKLLIIINVLLGIEIIFYLRHKSSFIDAILIKKVVDLPELISFEILLIVLMSIIVVKILQIILPLPLTWLSLVICGIEHENYSGAYLSENEIEYYLFLTGNTFLHEEFKREKQSKNKEYRIVGSLSSLMLLLLGAYYTSNFIKELFSSNKLVSSVSLLIIFVFLILILKYYTSRHWIYPISYEIAKEVRKTIGGQNN